MRRIFGVIICTFGLTLAGWVAYNLFIERLPETEGTSPLPAIVVSGLALYVGYKWVNGEQAG